MRSLRSPTRALVVTTTAAVLTLAVSFAGLSAPANAGTTPMLALAISFAGLSAPANAGTTTATRARRVSRSAARAPLARLQPVLAIADGSGWDWRRAGVVIRVGYHPEDCCHWGVYDSRDDRLWIGPNAFANPARLRYTVLHELGHAWQFNSGHIGRLMVDMARWRPRGAAALEAGADCVAALWGARAKGHYWSCPPAAARLVARRLAGDWNP